MMLLPGSRESVWARGARKNHALLARCHALECPPSMRPHVNRVLEGEYGLPPGYSLVPPLRALDIGANVGAWTIWARAQWPGCEIDCYEPHPDNAVILRRNVAALRPNLRVHEVAVLEDVDTIRVRLYDGKNNCGESSIWRGDEQVDDARMVEALPARDLPPADVLKIDTEGCELEILRGYLHLDRVLCVMLEWHSAADRWAIGAVLAGDFDCVRDDRRRPDRGVMVWVREDER